MKKKIEDFSIKFQNGSIFVISDGVPYSNHYGDIKPTSEANLKGKKVLIMTAKSELINCKLLVKGLTQWLTLIEEEIKNDESKTDTK